MMTASAAAKARDMPPLLNVIEGHLRVRCCCCSCAISTTPLHTITACETPVSNVTCHDPLYSPPFSAVAVRAAAPFPPTGRQFVV